MKKPAFVFLYSLIFLGCVSPSNQLGEGLKCSFDVDTIRADIQNTFGADSVVMYLKRIKEEAYFSEVLSPIVLVYNADTEVLNFKALPSTYYQRFDNFEEIENKLKQEAMPVANTIDKYCDTDVFNDVIIEFLKLDDQGEPIYRFICHYEELLK